MKSLVVFTGSFNPITKAHRKVLKTAVNKVGAELGLFVITNDAYLTQKLVVKSKTPCSFRLTENQRKEMIDRLSMEFPNLKFCMAELGDENPSTVKTLIKISKLYPGYRIYYLCGADKLKGVSNWKNFDTVFDKFGFIVTNRSDIDVDKIINEYPLLSNNRDSIVVIDGDEEISEISSTAIRNRFFSGESYEELMDKGPYEVMRKYSPQDFKPLTDEEVIEYTIKYGGRFGGNMARMKVFKDNCKLFKNWDKNRFGNIDDLINNTKVYTSPFTTNGKKYEEKFDCVNKDCADVALDLINEGLNPVILNMADKFVPCGGYNEGTDSQEESLSYMSTLSQSLFQFGDKRKKYIRESGIKLVENIYPLNINFGGIYSPNCVFFRHNFDKYYSLRKDTFSCSIISVPSLRFGECKKYINEDNKYFTENGLLTNEGIEIEKNKIRTILRIGIDNNHDSIILGAFGCGAFKMNVDEVSSLFKEVLFEDEFKNRFRKVVFAIYEGKGSSRKVVGSDGKFKPFYDKFSK